jgi:hypothetical protein
MRYLKTAKPEENQRRQTLCATPSLFPKYLLEFLTAAVILG